jgi:ActR/RegA family two-component response regulator
VLEGTEWNLAAAARILGLHRNSLKVRLAVLGIQAPGG